MERRRWKLGVAAGWLCLAIGCTENVTRPGATGEGGAGGGYHGTTTGGTMTGSNSGTETGTTTETATESSSGTETNSTSSSSWTDPDPSDGCTPFGACAEVPSDCLALVDNTGKTANIGLRVAQLDIAVPLTLAKGAIENIIESGCLMNLDECNLFGAGNFSWLLDLDRTQGKLKMGGAKPVADPHSGYCFVNETSPAVIAPVTTTASITNNSLTTTSDAALTVPIYLDAAGSSAILLPLKGLRVEDAQLSPDNNCIGRYNADTLSLDNQCLPDEEAGITYFSTAGLLHGYITLEDADKVIISALNQTLCVLLSNDSQTYGEKTGGATVCKRAANNTILLQGDWCSETNSAASGACADAFKFAAAFAASAVTIHGDCN